MSLESISDNEKTLPELAADRIVRMIVDGKFEKNVRLPNEFQLAEVLNVGRGTIREAIKILVSKNIVEIRRGCGTYVSDKPGIVDDPLGLTFFKDRHRLALDLYELRMIIEPKIAALAAERVTDEEIENIEKACYAIEVNINEKKPYTQEDIYFHECIAKSSKNQVVPNVIPIIHSAVEIFVDMRDEKLLQETLRTHRAIVDAIKARNSDMAEKAMIEHLAHNKKYIDKNPNI
jgi:GntR family transcriptional repressor for pyruvate dehydrogenase complex